jgi:uncharacterized membrane protein
MFFKKKEVGKQVKKIDKLITWLIIWGAVASMIGLSKTEKWKEIKQNVKIEWNKALKEWKSLAKKSYKVFWKVLVWALKIINKK